MRTRIYLLFLMIGGLTASAFQLQGPGCSPGSPIRCTPDQATIRPTGENSFHVILPANQRRGVTFPNTAGTRAVISNASGNICWDPTFSSLNGCSGPEGSSVLPARDIRFQPEEFIDPQKPAGALATKIEGSRIIFAVNDRDNDGAFADNTGYFEFDVAFQKSASFEQTTNWIKQNAIPLRTVEAGNGFQDMQPLKQLIGNARIVSLGEATHGSREFFQMKHRMLEFLATEMGFTIFSIEANMPESYRMNDYVLNGAGDPREILRGMYFWTWQTEEVLEMVEWMREFNKSGRGRVQFTGFDMQTATVASQIARDFVAKADPEYATTANQVMNEVTRHTTPLQGFGVASASLPVTAVAGKRVRYSGFIKTEAVRRGYAGLWMRLDGPNGATILDNMSNRGATGTRDWTPYEITMNVPSTALGAVFGVLHPGDGTAWFDTLSIEIDGVPYKTTADLDFESETLGLGAGGVGFALRLDNTVSNTGSQSLRSAYLNTPTTSLTEAIEQCGGAVEQLKSQRGAYRSKGLEETEIAWGIQNARVACQALEATAYSFTRDGAMAENVQWILDQNPNAKIVLWAHNGHVATGGYRGYVTMGSYLWNKYGTDMVIFGFSFNQGSFQAIDGAGTGLREFTVSPPAAETLDALYASAGIPLFAIDMRKVPATSPMREPLATRTVGSLYDARFPAGFFSELVAPDTFDAMIFIDRTTRARPLR